MPSDGSDKDDCDLDRLEEAEEESGVPAVLEAESPLNSGGDGWG